MAYDNRYVYLSGLLYVSDPGLMQAIGKKRDLMSMTCDWLGVSFDTYNDKENSLIFFTNPLGLRSDAAVSNDGTLVGENPPFNMNWNTFWDVKTNIDDKGWYVEMRIPISSLRFQPKDGKIVMGMSIFRWIPARDESYMFPEIPLNWGDLSSMKPSQYAEVEFEGLDPKKPLYISPYLLTGFEQSYELNDAETGFDYLGDLQLEPGLDIKYGISPNTTLDLTANTDFAQVEADDQQFNLTRFSLFFPEKRMFFLERSSIFDFEFGGNSNLFYSRRIGLHDDNPVRIYGGARLNSRVNDWDIGFLDMQTATFDDLPSENFGVFRVKKRVFNEFSYAGGMFTSRLGVDGSYNVAYGLDGVIRLFGDEYLTVRWAQTYQDGSGNNPFSLDPTKIMANWERRKREGFSYLFAAAYSGIDFDPGIGFEIFEDYWVLREDLIHTWISPDSAKLQSHSITFRNYHLNSVIDNSFLIYSAGPTWKFSTKNSWGGSFNVGYNYEYLEENFEILDPVLVPAGRYQFLNSKIMLNTPGSRTLSAIFMFDGGSYYDGIKMSPSVQPIWNIGASIELGGIYQFDYVDFPDRNQTLRNHIAGVRALYMLSTKLSLSAFVQYN
ncbi:MAG: carbohydrate binding family 9 domain-containing protein, partial [Bacteroidales bacterium]|nr:carbohydrate binding family 9 domain-containing protein [Bacteroidales bacterium]